MSDYQTGSPETLAFLRRRRSHPSITMAAPGPDPDQIRDLLTIATRVPDHGKLAPWRFVLYRAAEDGERIGAWLAARYETLHGPLEGDARDKELTRFTRAPLVIGVISQAADHPKIPVWEQQLSAGAVCMNLVTAAAAAGFASQWLSEWFAFDDEAARYLGARPGERFAGFVHIGTATQPPVERPRPTLDDLISNWTETD
ncbi:nitroreductase family protein [Roseibium sediminicola]|uniref:Putative NAD(P)H nitroreductase n=1 Tax=Roseibium sediminicola TaxID=2933272 RepID=A0ABT0GYM7_9HYPH|nr:nitroreductase [Roseibium sp. CAU 1639]MCK7614537.1 nitroreductase [Roseibium sp. CAU 1639]